MCPEARFTIAEGMKNGEIFPGPPCISLMCSRSIMSNPPMPEATYTPTSSRSDCSGFHCAIFTAKSAPARAIWMNRPIFLISFFSIHWNGSKFFTSPAIWQSNPVVSKCVMRSTPLFPATRFSQLSSVPMPSAQTNPTPVTTTRRVNSLAPSCDDSCALFALRVFLDVLDRVLHCGHFLGVFIRHFDPEGLFKRHYQFHLVERIRAQVVHERRGRCHFRFIHTQLLDD